MKKVISIITYSFLIIFFACNSENSNEGITKKSSKRGGVISFFPAEEFENRKSYEIYLEGFKCLKREDYECSKEYFERALKIDPNNTTILCGLGLTETRLFNYEKGSELLYKAIGIDSTYYNAHTNLGFNLYYSGKHKEAIDILNLVDVNNSDQSVRMATYFHLFMNYTSLQECKNALKYYNLLKDFADNKIFMENVEKFKKIEFYFNCP